MISCLFVFLAVLQNDHFLKLLISDSVETAVTMMSVLHSILGVNRLVVLMSLIFLNLKFQIQFITAL